MYSFSNHNSSASVSHSAATSSENVESDDVKNGDLEEKKAKTGPSYKLTWKVEDGQLVRHWVEV